jgi:gluconate 2-dehydrogenase gamma chain
MDRRDAIRLLGAVPLAGAVPWSVPDVQRAAQAVARLRQRGQTFQPKFFTPHEYQTVRVLADLVIPKDERSGSATDAGVPEFMDFMMTDRAQLQEPMRGGLAWLDTECRERFGKDFVDGADAERRAVLDDIAWPARAKPELSQGVAFFNRFRDLTASGFWSSKMGVADLPYIGNVALPQWNGCPEAQLKRLGVSYGD